MDSDEEMPEEEVESEEESEEEQELQEIKKAVKKARNLEGGDAKIKESLAFKNIDVVTDNQIINEVLKRVIRRLV